MSMRASVRRFLGCLLIAVLVACTGRLKEPFVNVTLDGIPAGAVKVTLKATFNDTTQTPMFSNNDMLDQITVSLPPDVRGDLQLDFTVANDAGCMIATGSTMVTVTANELYSVTVALTSLS